MDFVFDLPPDSKRRTGIVVFVDRFSKMVHLATVPAEVTAKQTARLFVHMVFRHHGMPIDIASDRDPRFTARFWQEVFTLLGTQLSMSTADHPQTDGQNERVNRVLVDALKSCTHSFHHWSDCLPMAEFAINNSVHVSTGHTPIYVNALRHPHVPEMHLTRDTRAGILDGLGSAHTALSLIDALVNVLMVPVLVAYGDLLWFDIRYSNESGSLQIHCCTWPLSSCFLIERVLETTKHRISNQWPNHSGGTCQVSSQHQSDVLSPFP
ncbi:unnamed protein product [Phytophthora fragariaefolia]|uniref:Unnamed protein product n=1 Tax=Phytophthora fragariaefolia TaxID=1490495 RepID=A0A9W7CNE8_9STRA|nr:unnamed protein product [Phytophthora fragariaefolia]